MVLLSAGDPVAVPSTGGSGIPGRLCPLDGRRGFWQYRPAGTASGWSSAWLAGLAAPAAYVNAMSGQNGAFTAALMGGGILLLEKRPLMAGTLLGALCIKPHLALLVPIALAAGGHWRAFFAAGLTALALTGLSFLLVGAQASTGVLQNAPINMLLLEHGDNFWH